MIKNREWTTKDRVAQRMDIEKRENNVYNFFTLSIATSETFYYFSLRPYGSLS